MVAGTSPESGYNKVMVERMMSKELEKSRSSKE